jgi:hypothetical protein
LGGISAELKVYLIEDNNKTMAFYDNGIMKESNEWIMGFLEVPIGEHAIVFEVYGDIYFSNSSAVAIDDVYSDMMQYPITTRYSEMMHYPFISEY